MVSRLSPPQGTARAKRKLYPAAQLGQDFVARIHLHSVEPAAVHEVSADFYRSQVADTDRPGR
jgi:hypothetical protein